ncbi:hypothetical protein D3C73_17260 [compost metagenome]
MDEHRGLEQRTVSFGPLERLEELVYDPYIDSVNAKADEIEDILNTLESSEVERTAFRDSLNRDWRFMNTTLRVTGSILVDEGKITKDIPSYDRYAVEDEPFLSTGFTIIPVAAVMDDEALVSYKVGYSFSAARRSVTMFRDEMISQFPNDSHEAVEKRLLYHHADEALFINDRLQQQDEKDSLRVLGFRDYYVDVDLFEESAEQFIVDAQRHLFESMNFDEDLPYVIDYMVDAPGTEDDLSELRLIVNPRAIVLRPLDDNSDTTPCRYTPWMELTVHSSNQDWEPTRYCIPLRCIQSMYSIRDHIYRSAL